MRIALVHDYFREYGGAERVVEALHELFPDAPVFTAFVDKEALGMHWQKFANWEIHESWAANIPGIKKLHSPLRVLADRFFASFDFSQFDVVISSTNMYMAKGVITHKPTVHICYCHTPPRSLYGYTTMTDWKKSPIIRVGGELINHYMRMVDAETATHPDFFIANSKEVQKRIEKFYRRESTVIYPPVDVPAEPPSVKKRHNGGYLFVGRLAASKHVDLVVKACTQLGKPLTVVGTGAALEGLQTMAGPTVKFLGAVNDETLHKLYADSSLLLYPAEDEDFGIVPIEAMAYGTPVVVHRSGGFLESVIEGKTGEFVDELTIDGVIKAIQKAEKHEWDAKVLYERAKMFSKQRFQKEIGSFVERVWKK